MPSGGSVQHELQACSLDLETAQVLWRTHRSPMTKPRGLQRSHSAAYTERCRWTGCSSDRHDEPDAPPLCTKHLIECATYMADRMRLFLLDPDREAKRDIVLANGKAEHAEHGAVVYYVRLGDHVKIGTTKNLQRRLESLYVSHDPDALLGWEPGGEEVETMRHAQFGSERVWANRELFNPSPRLLAHIATLEKRTA